MERELLEETGLAAQVLELIKVLDRVQRDAQGRTQYHFVIVDYLCARTGGSLRAGGDATDARWVSEGELEQYALTVAATRVLRRASAPAAIVKS
jgi:8-oxo-dGTP diphosphatase